MSLPFHIAQAVVAIFLPIIATGIILNIILAHRPRWLGPLGEPGRFPRFDCYRDHINSTHCRVCGREIIHSIGSERPRFHGCYVCWHWIKLKRAAHGNTWLYLNVNTLAFFAAALARRGGRPGFRLFRWLYTVHLATSSGWLLWAWRYWRNRRRDEKRLSRRRGT